MKTKIILIAAAIMCLMSVSVFATSTFSLRGIDGDKLNLWSNGERGQGVGWKYDMDNRIYTTYKMKQTGVNDQGKKIYDVKKKVVDRSGRYVTVTQTEHTGRVGTYNERKGTFKIMGQTWKVENRWV